MFKYVCVDADLLGEEHGFFAASSRSYCLQTLPELLVQSVYGYQYLPIRDTYALSPRPRADAVCCIPTHSLKIKKPTD